MEERDKKSYELKYIQTARIPLIKLTLKEDKVKTHFDILANNILGVINSKFMSVYGQVPWLRQLVILVKMWAKHPSRNLIKETMFSSYSFSLLLLHFLIEKNKLQLIMDAREREESSPHFMFCRETRENEEKFKVYYTFKTDPKNATTLKRVSIYDLLVEFFGYYSEAGEHWRKGKEDQIITVDGSKDKKFEEEFMFTMKDPFDERHNPGRVKKGE